MTLTELQCFNAWKIGDKWAKKAFIYSGFLRKSPLENFFSFFFLNKWSILIGSQYKRLNRICWYLSSLYLFLLKIIINYKCSNMSRKNYYLDVRIQVACDDFLITNMMTHDTILICFFYILFNSFSDTCIFKICN